MPLVPTCDNIGTPTNSNTRDGLLKEDEESAADIEFEVVEKEQCIQDNTGTIPVLIENTGDRQLEYYKQRRDDARSYAILVFQVLTLLLTTLSIVVGWGAKDFFSQKYNIAFATTSPTLYAMKNGNVKDSAGNMLATMSDTETQKELKKVGKEFSALVWVSPTFSFILCSGVFFLSLLIGMLIVIVYVLQKRRYRSHQMEGKLGLEPDAPLYDPVLTTQSIITLGAILFGICLIAWGIMIWQCIVVINILKDDAKLNWVLISGIILACIATTFKLKCDIKLAWHSTLFEREAGWTRRWPSAVRCLESIKGDIHKRLYDLPEEIMDRIALLEELCKNSANEDNAWERRFIWHQQVEPEMNKLVRAVVYSNICEPQFWVRLRALGESLSFKRKFTIIVWGNDYYVRLKKAAALMLKNEYCTRCQAAKRSWLGCKIRFKCGE